MTLEQDLLSFIDGQGGSFHDLALRLYQQQCQENPLYAAMAGGLSPQHWIDIPAVPVTLFKELDLACFDIQQPHPFFYTSGTTSERPGVHHLKNCLFYDRGALRHFRARVPQAPTQILSLCPPAGGTSSLGHMVALFGDVQGFFDTQTGLSPQSWAAIQSQNTPIFLAATAFALDALLALPGQAALGPESLVMVTGGFKGRRVRLDAPGLYASLGQRFGQTRVVGEYGMTELSSQLWSDPVPAGQQVGDFVAPPWLRVYTVDPATGQPASPGLLRFVDLANRWSVLAIETMDMGIVDPDPAGDRVRLLGRLSGAALRGCSLTAEDLRPI